MERSTRVNFVCSRCSIHTGAASGRSDREQSLQARRCLQMVVGLHVQRPVGEATSRVRQGSVWLMIERRHRRRRRCRRRLAALVQRCDETIIEIQVGVPAGVCAVCTLCHWWECACADVDQSVNTCMCISWPSGKLQSQVHNLPTPSIRTASGPH